MGLPEPANELYAAVKAISNPWPPDDEALVGELGRAWRTAGEAATQAAGQVEASCQAVAASWQDLAGSAFGSKLTSGAQALQKISLGATGLAGSADRYAQELLDAKTIITQSIAQHLPLYRQLALMPGGPGAQAKLAADLAGQLGAMIAAKAAALGGAVPAPAPAAAKEPGSDNAETAGDVLGVISAVASVVALFPPAAPIALPISVITGAAAMGLHGVDMVANGKWEDPNAWITLGNDAMGLLPGAKGIGKLVEAFGDSANMGRTYTEITEAALGTPTAKDWMSGGVNLTAQVPTVVDFFVDDPAVTETKNEAGEIMLKHGTSSEARSSLDEMLRRR
ncbi:hypothetical protein LZ318_12905 [Saccharopolyspora indica]|uniref:WXG100-like domain-containing protein n=1 Tax=Saccharopolyspora indica TaxID=1229659 RepID=UPI0022EB51CE|nr:hypothetical protein [Saccharopolyspora indica]MDA3647206.1 hypothetical protein [Saccharopolyspora indica]